MASAPFAYPHSQIEPRTAGRGLALPVPLGPRMGMRWMLGAGGVSAWLGLHDTAVTDVLLRYLRPGDVFFDAGAGCGYHTLLGARAVAESGAVVAFEPGADRDSLQAHLQLNRITNVTVSPADLSAPGWTLDEWCGSHVHRAPTLLRIGGSPGTETRILRGAAGVLKRSRPVVVLEANSTHALPPIASYSACRAVFSEVHYRVVAEFTDSPLDPILMIGIPG